MAASQAGYFNIQEFTDAGLLLVGGRVYTYTAGTTTQKTAYTDAAGTVPQTYTSDGLGGQYIALNARGELPTPLYLTAGAYDITLKRPDGSTVWTRRATPVADSSDTVGAALVAYEALLQTNTNVAGGAALVGFGPSLSYASGSVGAALRQKLFAALFVQVGDTDFGQALNRAILYAIQTYTQATIELPAGGAFTITTKVLIPTGIYVNLNSCVITGGGLNYATPMFETAYNNAGVITTNIGTAAQSHQVLNAGVIGNGAIIQNAGVVFNLQDTHDVCAFGGISFSNITQAVNATYPFYTSFYKMTVRNTPLSVTLPAFQFANFNNVVRTDELFVNGRTLAFEFDTGSYALKIVGCSAEACTNGMLFTGTVNSLQLRSCYFENNTGNALQFSGAGSSFSAVDIDDCWFNLNGKAIQAINFVGRWGSGNTLNTGTNAVDFSDPTCKVVVEIAPAFAADTLATPTLPANYSLSKNCVVSRTQVVFSSGTGLPIVKATEAGSNIIPLQYYGDSGDPNANNAIFCTSSSSNPGGTPFNIIVDTNITFRNYAMLLGYSFLMTDNGGSYSLFGVVFGGTNAKALDAVGKTVTASNNGGKLRLTFGSFSHPTGVFSCTGVVRHM